MNTTINAARQVYVIIDGVECGPYDHEAFAQNLRNGVHGADCIWRFTDSAEYQGIKDVPVEDLAQAIPPPLPKKPKSIFPAVFVISICVFAIVVAVGVIGLFAFSYAKADHDMKERAAIQREVQKQMDVFLNSGASAPKLSHDRGNRFVIEGTVTNSTGRLLALVSVEFSIFDLNGNRIKSASGSIDRLEPFEVWSYKIPVYHDGDGISCSLKQLDAIPQ